MKAMVLEALGLANLKLQELPTPKPGPGQVLVRLRAASLNYRDTLVVEGGYGSRQRSSGLIPISDGAGEIAALGADVESWRVGDRVVGCFFPNWRDGPPSEEKCRGDLGGGADGVACEYRVFAQDAILPIPDHLSFIEAASLPCAGVTAWQAVRAQGQIGPGQWVLTQGTGGVSLFALQFAAIAGAWTIATSSSDAKRAKLGELGATHTIDYRADAEWGMTARRLAGGQGVDLVVDIGGAATLRQALRAVKVGGAISIIGVIGGARAEINLPVVAIQNLRLQGIGVGSNAMFVDLLTAMADHRTRPVIDDKIFPLEELPAALAYLKRGGHIGKICIEIA
jgi:alcohol dehydrogenase